MANYVSKVKLPGSTQINYVKDIESQSMIGAAQYSSKNAYSVGEFIFYRGEDDTTPVLYRVTTAITAAENTSFSAISSKLTQTSVSKELQAKLNSSEKGASSGVAELDTNGKVPLNQLPDAILGQMIYGGTLTANEYYSEVIFSTNGKTTIQSKIGSTYTVLDSVILSESSGNQYNTDKQLIQLGYASSEGLYFIATNSTTFASMTINNGDWVLSTGSGWTKIDNTDSVTSVNNKTGAVTIGTNTTKLSASITSGDVSLKDSTALTYGNANVGSSIDVGTSLTGTVTFNTDAIKGVSCSQSFNTNGIKSATCSQSFNQGAIKSASCSQKFNTDAIKSASCSQSFTTSGISIAMDTTDTEMLVFSSVTPTAVSISTTAATQTAVSISTSSADSVAVSISTSEADSTAVSLSTTNASTGTVTLGKTAITPASASTSQFDLKVPSVTLASGSTGDVSVVTGLN